MPRPFLSLRIAGLALLGLLPSCTRTGPGSSAAEHGSSLTLEQAADRHLPRPDVTIRYREIGRGEPVVLLHGYVDRLEMWFGVADSLARTHRVIVPDLRGFGTSIPDEQAPYGRAMLTDVITLLDHLAIERAHLIGYSLGALIATGVALEQPARVASVTLVAGPFFADSATAARALRPFVADLEQGRGLTEFFRWIVPTVADSVLDPLARQIYHTNDRRAMTEVLRLLPAVVPPQSRLTTLQIPAVAVVGRIDPMLEYSRAIAARWPGLKLVELADADHVVVYGVPEVVSEFRAIARAPRPTPLANDR